MKIFLFMVDHKLRDLISLLIIKKELEKKGSKVFFCRNGMELPVAIKNKVDTVILTQVLTKEWKNISLNLKKFGCNVVSLPSEGNPFIDKAKIELAHGNNFGYEHLDIIFAWRKKIFNLTKKFNKNSNVKVIYSGFHRLISYTKKYKNFRKKLTKNYKEKNKINILFVSNFLGADYHDFPNNSFKHEINKDLALKESKHRKSCINFLKKLITTYPNLNIILKIHPYEKPDMWIKNFEHSGKNFKISVGDYIEGVIEQSDIIIGRNCHTLTEASILNKFIINLSLKNDPWHTTLKGEKVKYPTIKNFEDFEKFLKIFRKMKKNPLDLTLLEDFRFKNNKLDSIKIIADSLEKLDYKRESKLSKLFEMKQIIKYFIFVRFDYFIHDFIYLKNKKKKINKSKFYIDYRYRVEKHYHKSDIKFIEKKLPN
jgi:surface carbohydrate biosynthesis protein